MAVILILIFFKLWSIFGGQRQFDQDKTASLTTEAVTLKSYTQPRQRSKRLKSYTQPRQRSKLNILDRKEKYEFESTF